MNKAIGRPGTFQLTFDKGKKEGKDQESIQSITAPDPGYQWESDNFTIRHHKREPRGQPFPSRWGTVTAFLYKIVVAPAAWSLQLLLYNTVYHLFSFGYSNG